MNWQIVQDIAVKLFPSVFQTGTLCIGASGDFFVSLPFTPCRVDVNLGCDHGVSVCQGENDGFDVKIVLGGFFVTANLHSQSREISWFAIK